MISLKSTFQLNALSTVQLLGSNWMIDSETNSLSLSPSYHNPVTNYIIPCWRGWSPYHLLCFSYHANKMYSNNGWLVSSEWYICTSFHFTLETLRSSIVHHLYVYSDPTYLSSITLWNDWLFMHLLFITKPKFLKKLKWEKRHLNGYFLI